MIHYEDEPGPGGGVTLDDALRGFLFQSGLGSATALADTVRCWHEVVGSEVARHVVPWRIDADALIVVVDDPAWATEVGFLTQGILAALAERLRHVVLNRIKVHVKPNFALD